MRKNICLWVIVLVLVVIRPTYGNAHDNPKFKKWCVEMFEYGEYVYEAYKHITFDIDFTNEQEDKDEWQTPLETAKSGKGDCEDITFLFFDYLNNSQNDTQIVWGFVVKNGDNVARRHVWCELTARNGERYVVEGFTRSWRGIIPMEENILRFPILKISSHEFSRLLYSLDIWDLHIDYNFPKENEIQIINGGYIVYGHNGPLNDVIFRKFQEKTPKFLMINIETEVDYIFKKLYLLFAKYKKGE